MPLVESLKDKPKCHFAGFTKSLVSCTGLLLFWLWLDSQPGELFKQAHSSSEKFVNGLVWQNSDISLSSVKFTNFLRHGAQQKAHLAPICWKFKLQCRWQISNNDRRADEHHHIIWNKYFWYVHAIWGGTEFSRHFASSVQAVNQDFWLIWKYVTCHLIRIVLLQCASPFVIQCSPERMRLDRCFSVCRSLTCVFVCHTIWWDWCTVNPWLV